MRVIRILLLSLISQTVAGQQMPPGSVQGTVIRQGNGDVLRSAIVELRSTGSAAVTTTTDQQGRFSLSNLAPGEYRLLVSRAGYVSAQYGQRQVNGPGQTLRIGAGQHVENIVIPMTPGGVISGRVTDRGEPAGNTQVFVVKASYELGERIQQGVIGARTNDLGEYSVFWLPPGRYYVWAGVFDNEVDAALSPAISTGDYNTATFLAATGRYVFSNRYIRPSNFATERHVLTYFPNTTDFRRALPIDVGPGAEIRGVDIQADAQPSLRVRGVVSGIPLSAAGKPVQVNVSLLPADTANFIVLPSGPADANGAFDLEHVSPGEYILYASAGNHKGRVPIDVTNRDVNGINITLSPGVDISGRVVIERREQMNNPDPALNALRIGLMIDPVIGGFRTNTAAHFSGPVTPSADGSFSIIGAMPGGHRVYIGPLLTLPGGLSNTPRGSLPAALTNAARPAGLESMYVKSIRLGDRDVLNDGLSILDNPRDALLIVLGTNPGLIEGRVLDNEQKPVGSASVVLVPESGLRFRMNHAFTSTNAAGQFQIANIAPGAYRLLAWEYAERGAWQDPDYIKQHEHRGQLVRVEEGGKMTLTLTSIR